MNDLEKLKATVERSSIALRAHILGANQSKSLQEVSFLGGSVNESIVKMKSSLEAAIGQGYNDRKANETEKKHLKDHLKALQETQRQLEERIGELEKEDDLSLCQAMNEVEDMDTDICGKGRLKCYYC